MEIRLWRELLIPYELAVKELVMKFNHLKKEHQERDLYSPIEEVTGRVKSINSILEKMQRKNISWEELEEKVEDIAGVRIICQFYEDIEKVADLIQKRSDMKVLEIKDYVTHMKESGYRSYHMIISYAAETLDGRKEINDQMRPFRNGKGSYDLIVPKFQKLADSRGQERYYIRGTFTRNNLDFSEDILHFADLGFKQMSIEPVVGDETDPYAIREEDLPKIMEEYDKLAKIMIQREQEGKGFNFFHFMIDLDGGPCLAKRLSGCGSGTEYLAVTPWGDLYPCHQFVGQEEFLMGNVDEGIKRPEIADDFRSCNVYSKEKCRNCFAKFYCSGGCMANAYNFHGTIHDTYEIGCEMQRKRVECAIMIKAALADAEAMRENAGKEVSEHEDE